MPDIISMEQCRAARALLDWTQEELANAANLSLSTVRDFEKGRRTPIPNNMLMLKQVFEDEGLVFTYHEEEIPLGVEFHYERLRI
ncbi:helix-turn-helix domain-containing protein [Hansschlegelia sp. KR7-227]|uniref:helix-turn-helix domain-containing protein n=1 Tax=Hansschlegelia sp. KR7-227 TaxID=3400914 RepID=UPI003C107796